MTKTIYEIMFTLSKEHKLIKSFRYGTLSHNQGIGEEKLPQVFLESPMYYNAVPHKVGSVKFTFDILFNSTCLDVNLNEVSQQILAEEVAKSFIARLNDEYTVNNYSFLQLNNFYDNNCFGIRTTVEMIVNPNIIWCSDLDNNFNPDKEFETDNLLPDIDTPDADGCAVFSLKLPSI